MPSSDEYREAKHRFTTANPERHGRDSSGCCLICGDKVLSGKIFCTKHCQSYDKEYVPDRYKWDTVYKWSLRHKDFNGRDPDIVNHCAECSAPIRDMDYLCTACREQAGLID